MTFLNPKSVWYESEILVAFAVKMKKSPDSKEVQDHCDAIIGQLDQKLLRKCRALRKSLCRRRKRLIEAQRGISLSNEFFGKMVNMLEKAKRIINDLESIESYISNDIAFHGKNRQNRKEVEA